MPIITVPETPFAFPAYRSPACEDRTEIPEGATAYLGLSYAIVDGYREIAMDVYVPTERSGPVPCVVWIHGGAWMNGDRRYEADIWPTGEPFASLIRRGYAVATIDYRHAREAAFPAQLHDAKAAVRYLRHYAEDLGIDPTRLAAWGGSAGGHLAALLGLVSGRADLEGELGVGGDDSSVSAVVDWFGVSDVTTMPSLVNTFASDAGQFAPPQLAEEPIEIMLAGAVDRSAAERDLSPVNHVSASAPPFLLAHGDADGLVPFAQSQLLHDRLRAAGASAVLHIVPGADHVWIGAELEPLVTEAIDFLDSVLR